MNELPVNRLLLVTVPFSLLLAACGDVVVDGSGGGGGDTTASSTSTTTTTKIPGQCVIPADAPGPYPVTFRFENPAGSTVFPGLRSAANAMAFMGSSASHPK